MVVMEVAQMKNAELIATGAVSAGIYTQKEVDRLMKEKGQLPIHTAAAWRKQGMQVKTGENPAFFVRLWRFRPAEGGDDTDSGFYAARSAVYLQSQVEPMGGEF